MPRRHAIARRVLLALLLTIPFVGWGAEEREFFSTNINRLKIIVTSNELPVAVIQAHITNQFIKARNSLDDRSALGLRVEGNTYQFFVKDGYQMNLELNRVISKHPDQVVGGLYHFYVEDQQGKRLLTTYTNIYDFHPYHLVPEPNRGKLTFREQPSKLFNFEINGVYTNKTGTHMVILFKPRASMILHVCHPFTWRNVSFFTPFEDRPIIIDDKGIGRPLVDDIQVEGSAASNWVRLIISSKSRDPQRVVLNSGEWVEFRISGSIKPVQGTRPAKPLDIPYKKSSAQPDIVEFNSNSAPRPRIQP